MKTGIKAYLDQKHHEGGRKIAAQNVSFFDTPESARKRDPRTLPHTVTVQEWQDLMDDVVRLKDTAWVLSLISGVALAVAGGLLLARLF